MDPPFSPVKSEQNHYTQRAKFRKNHLMSKLYYPSIKILSLRACGIEFNY